MFPPWSLSGVTQLGLHFATPRCHHVFLPRDAPFDLWVWFSCTRGWFGSRIRWGMIRAHLVLLTYHTLCLIALMWAILGIDSRAFWLWWTRSYGMTLHWGIAISESFFLLDDHYVEAYSSQLMMDFWATSIPRRISDVLFHIGAWDMIGAFHLVYFTQGHTPFGPWWFLGIAVPWRRLDSFHIGVPDMTGWFLRCDNRSIAFSSWLTYFLRWLDQDTGTYESM